MTRIGPVRRGALLVTGLLAAAGGSLATTTASQAADTGTPAPTATTAAAQRTTVRFAVDGCHRCQVRLYQAREGRRGVWQSHQHRVRDGVVAFNIPTRRTHGMSVSVLPPWERHGIPTGYVTMVAFRYAGEEVGSTVTRRATRTKHRASGCWAGTDLTGVTMPLKVRKVRVQGTTGETTGSIAWTPRTQEWWRPMLRAGDGILGAQDIIPCRPAAHHAPAQRQAAPRTDLTLRIRGCDRCTVQLQHAIDGEAEHVWTSRQQRVGADHRVVFDLRTARTHGLSFVLRAPWGGDTGAVPNMVTRYAGHRVGRVVHRVAARHARRAEGCWAGTRAASARLRFQVDRVRARTLEGRPTKAPLVYSRHTLPSWKPMVRTYRGTIGNQDAFYCERP